MSTNLHPLANHPLLRRALIHRYRMNHAIGLGDAALSFHPSRAGSNLQVGDTWTVAITGAAPNATVTVFGGNGTNYPLVTNTMGTTDAAGNFTLSGTLTPDTIGQWQETWSVGGVSVGSLQFNVVLPSTGTGGTGTGTGGSGGSGGTGSSGTGGNQLPVSTTPASCFKLFGSSEPSCIGPVGAYTAAAAAALILLLVMGGKR